MVTANLVIHFYKYFYNKKYLCQSSFSVKLSARDLACIDKFIVLISDDFGVTVGSEFLYRYFIFQFQYWEQAKKIATSEYAQQIIPSFIVGPKAYKRYKDRNTDFDYKLINSSFETDYRIVKDDLVKQERVKAHVFIVKKGVDTEAPVKLASYNTAEGLVNCIDFSTLFNPKSTICLGCKFASDCKKILKAEFPVTYRNRGIID